MSLFGDIGRVFKNIGGFFSSSFAGPSLPSIPKPQPPPPPVAPRPEVPSAMSQDVQEAGAEQRALFRNRGRRTTLLTPGGGAGVTTDVLGRTR